ncbi:hypothetical protein RND81_05G008200 [Saponaria officinalis]|uniref:Reverse transcriptase zinc-binding domain-containing protein n=1 Tax=Saponaria officinalis TaxID=3572 RepID=A0AAW1KT39_SAPOF
MENFLWDGGVDFKRSPLVSWDKVCKPKSEGGLGLKNDVLWNKAAVGKLVWWVAYKTDHLWVRWINHTYLKGRTWQNFSPSTSSTWYWRKICQIKDLLADAYRQNQWENQTGKEYTIAKGYEWIRDKGQKVPWNSLVWNSWTVPKYSLLAWIYHCGNMNTKSKLYTLGISEDNTCYLCGSGVEDLDHIFFDCAYSRKIIDLLREKLHMHIPYNNILGWRLNRSGPKDDQGALNAIINASCYHIWHQRNTSRVDLKLLRPKNLVDYIMNELKLRFRKMVDGIELVKASRLKKIFWDKL